MFPTLSPYGASHIGGEGAGNYFAEVLELLLGAKALEKEDLDKILSLTKSRLPRLKGGERLDGYLRRNPNGFLRKEDQRVISNQLPGNYRGLRAAAKTLFGANCRTIHKFIRVWNWVDTCLALSFAEETQSITEFKTRWWIILAHDIASSRSVHYACKKWGAFSLYLTLHFGGSIQPLPQWESWFPQFPEGTWMTKQPGTLTRQEKAFCRILSDKRGLPSGDWVTKEKALSDNLKALTKGDTLTTEQEADLVAYSGMAAQAIKETAVKAGWFSKTAGHISLSNSACFENTRDEGGKRVFILASLRSWLAYEAKADRVVQLPTGECYEEKAGLPRWKTVHPPGYEPAQDLPSGKRVTTGLLTEDFADGEQERVGFQLFAWAYDTLLEDGYLDQNGRSTGKPMPISRVALGEPGCKARVVTRSQAAFIVYGQPFAHAMRELLESHPALRAGLSSGYQLHEWLKNQTVIPNFVMVGDFESATDHIQHRAGRIALKKLLNVLNADRNGYAQNYVDLLLSPRRIEEDGVVTITNSGCLMGEPGAKIALTFLAMVANCYARRGPPSPRFATAGDDQIDGDDDPNELLRYAEASKITTMVPSESKWGIFRYSCVYCQQLLDVEGTDPKMGEISVPKPRLLSPETKSGRGDDDTNPAYGKASNLAREFAWCDDERLKACYVMLFLRNMRQFINKSPQIFLHREWGGLGLPGIDQSRLLPFLPEWHINLIRRRESGDEVARKILNSWSSTRIMSRGLLESSELEEAYSPVLEYLPTATIDQIDLDLPPNARYKERLKAARVQGWIPIREFYSAIRDSQTYAHIWDLSFEGYQRGYSSIPWRDRNTRMEELAKSQQPFEGELLPVPESPSWQPGMLVMASALGIYQVEGVDEDPENETEEGQIKEYLAPIIGKSASPRMFLHYDNYRLILNATSRKRNSNPDISDGLRPLDRQYLSSL